MKKILTVVAVAFMALCSTALISCNDNDDDSTDTSSQLLFKDAEVTAIYNFSEDFLKVYDVTLNVTGFDGKTQSFAITKSGEQKQVILTTTSTTGTATANYTFKVKDSFTSDATKTYDFSASNIYQKVVHFTNGSFDSESNTSLRAYKGGGLQIADKATAQEVLNSLTEYFGTSTSTTFTLVNGEFE